MKRKPKKILQIDVSNLLFRVAAVQKFSPYAKDATIDDLVGISMHVSLQSIFKYYNRCKPDFLIFAFDGDNNWRKEYTAKNKSRLPYKGQRVRDPEMEHYYRLLEAFRDTMKAFTSICCIYISGMEADDVIAGVCQTYAGEDCEIDIVSGDKDFTQLLKLPNVRLINPDDGKFRNSPDSKDYEPDIDYWLFKKCIRGDTGDNVPSAYPRVREVKIKKAYESEYEKVNIMNSTWVQTLIEGEGTNVTTRDVTHRVGDLYLENQILMDLSKQPAEIRNKLIEGIKDQVENFSNYSHFQYLRFLEEYNLQRVREDSTKFIEMFTNNQRFMNGEKDTQIHQQVVKPKMSPKEQLEMLKNKSLLTF
jgi:5'-3' exonuclease